MELLNLECQLRRLGVPTLLTWRANFVDLACQLRRLGVPTSLTWRANFGNIAGDVIYLILIISPTWTACGSSHSLSLQSDSSRMP